jgi:hypothetical protein
MFIPLEAQEQHQPPRPPSLIPPPPPSSAALSEHAQPTVAMTLQQLITQGTLVFPQNQM